MTTKKSNRNVLQGLLTRAALTIFSAMLLMQLPACENYDKEHSPINKGDDETTITFSVNVPKGFTPTSYALSEEDEEAISTVDVLLFDKDGDQNFISGPHYGILNGSDVTIRIPSAAENYNMAVFANCRAELNKVFSTSSTKAEVLASLTRTVTAGNADDGLVGGVSAGWLTTEENKTIPMYGEYKSGEAVKLVRMLARINVTIANEDKDGNPITVPFTLSEVYLCNYNSAGQIAPASDWTESTPTVVSGAQQIGFDKSIKYATVADNKLEREIYTFEANAGVENELSTNTCIVIGGDYNNSGITTYYRIDFVNTAGNYLPLLRNHTYETVVSKIGGSGYNTPESAFNSRPVNIEYDIVAWGNSNIVDAVYSGQYAIGVSSSSFSFDSAPRGTTTGDNILIIKTNNTAGWSWSVDGGASGWLSLTNMDGTAIAPSTPVVSTSSTVRLSLSQNTDGSPRSATIKLTSGNVSYSVSVTQSNLANSDELFVSEAAEYSLRPNGGRIFIPVSRANGGSVVNLNSGDVFTAEVKTSTPVEPTMPVIKSAKPVGVGSSGHIYVETGSGSGTAVVALKKGGTEICTWTITVREPEANSYIVAPGDKILIPVSQAYRAQTPIIGNGDTDADAVLPDTWFSSGGEDFASQFVWKDNQALSISHSVIGTGNSAYLYVSPTSTNQEGNAVIAIKNTSGIRWSWHIWVANYTPTDGGGGFMDRNLGALYSGTPTGGQDGKAKEVFGLMYQWGRKDPIPGSSGYSGSTVVTLYNESGSGTVSFSTSGVVANSLQLSITNPTKIYTNSSDWYTNLSSVNNQNHNLWGGWDSPQTKTVYDPCPPGWRVPRSTSSGTTWTSPWADIDTATGKNWTNGLSTSGYWRPTHGGWYPVAGYRNDRGPFESVGAAGCYWSASPGSTNDNKYARALLFLSSDVNPSRDSFTRAVCMSVRCRQE